MNKMQNIIFGALGNFVKNTRYSQASPFIYGRVLDVGCGTTKIMSHLNRGCLYTGVDRFCADKPYLIKADIENKQERKWISGRYNSIVMLAVIEHLQNPKEVLTWLKTVIHKPGRLVITTPTIYGHKLDNIFFGQGFDHTFIFDKNSITSVVESAGYEIQLFEYFELGMNQLVVAQCT